MNKALFLDRDGTINIDYGYVYQPEKFVFVDGIVELAQKAQDKGYKIIVVTNQSGIARGYFTENDFTKICDHMKAEFKKASVDVTDVFHCPHLEHEDRKPNPGMFIKAQKAHDIDMQSSISVGDNERDIEAALKAGVRRNYLLSEDVNRETKANKVVSRLRDILEVL